jgi:hypothetical protein
VCLTFLWLDGSHAHRGTLGENAGADTTTARHSKTRYVQSFAVDVRYAGARCDVGVGARCDVGVGARCDVGVGARCDVGVGARCDVGVGARCDVGVGARTCAKCARRPMGTWQHT